MYTSKPAQSMIPEAFIALVEQRDDTRFGFLDGELVEVPAKVLPASIRALLAYLLVEYLDAHPRIGVATLGVLYVLDGIMYRPDASVNVKPNPDKLDVAIFLVPLYSLRRLHSKF